LAGISSGQRTLLGDCLALLSALFYAIYVILLKVRIRSESRIDIQLFFGFVGLFNILACWPIGVILHFTGVERFELPTTGRAVAGLLVNVSFHQLP
jgi:solute carrier family 35 protein F5